MKKMNLNFLWLKGKIVLPLFLLIGLFMFSASSVSAQYVNTDTATKKIAEKLSKLPPRTATLRRADSGMNPQMIKETVNELRYSFGQLIIRDLRNGKSVSEAIESTYKMAKNRIPAGTPGVGDYVDAVKQEYVDLLKN